MNAITRTGSLLTETLRNIAADVKGERREFNEAVTPSEQELADRRAEFAERHYADRDRWVGKYREPM